MHEQMEKVMLQAARLQKLVPDAILVGGSKKALEFQAVKIDGLSLNIPTIDEITRIKAFLIVKRNQVRDYLDFATLCDKTGIQRIAQIVDKLDEYYTDDLLQSDAQEKPALSQLLRQLSNPQPKDYRSIEQLPDYKGTVEK